MGALAWSLAVIVWGAYVRASGSGAGCGDHWPNCNGELIPRSPTMQTLVEYTHRTTSGLALLSVIVLAIWALIAHPSGHAVRRTAAWSLLLMITEALLGALLVKLELVANNATANRAVAMSVHLVNTFLLIASMALCAFRAWTGDARLRWAPGAWVNMLSLVGVVVLGMTGAVAALGDTLAQQAVFNPFVALLIQLRIIHPFTALAVTALVLFAAGRAFTVAKPWAIGLMTAVVVQLAVGLTNVILQVPIGIQLVHLLLADAVWLLTVICTASVISAPVTASSTVPSGVAVQRPA